MNKKDLRKFLEFASKMSGSGDYEIHLGMNRRDVDTLKGDLGIHDALDAKKLLKQFDENADLVLSKIILANKQEQSKILAERQQAYNDLQAKTNKLKAIKPKKVNKIKEEKVRKSREKKLEKLNAAAITIDSTWVIPADSSEQEFVKLIKNRGLGFVRDKFGISNRDIFATIRRLNLNINIDLIPR